MIVKKLKEWIFPSLIVAICVFIAWKNYTPGTFLIGWDSLHPEFNFPLAFRRIFFGVWRQDQGLGDMAIHSHMVDLPRIFLLWLSSFVLPANFLRYFYIFSCLTLGPLGIYFFLKYVFEREKTGFVVSIASFLGALFYLLNLGTLQHFFVPFEMFTTAFAFLPWLFLFFLKYLREGKRKNLVFFFVFSFVSTPMAYAATLFYACIGCLVLFGFCYLLLGIFKITNFKRFVFLLLVILAVNSFWLLPNVYSIINQSRAVSNSKINTLFSAEAVLRSQSFGDWQAVLINKSFLFDWKVFDFAQNGFDDLMAVWNRHLADERVVVVGYLTVVISFLGLVISLIRRNKAGIGLSVVAIFSLFFLFNLSGPSANLYLFLSSRFDIFREGMRMPFTKFSIPFMLATSFFFGYFFLSVFEAILGRFTKNTLAVFVCLAVFSSLFYFMSPVFNGDIISPVVRRSLPKGYSDVFDWFLKNDSQARVALLPLNSLWGWEYHNWKYEGSGFLGFGLANPLLVRDYDRWSPYNETFFSEAARALYASDNQAFDNALRKHQVKYLLLDESILNAGGDQKLLFVPEFKQMMRDLGYQNVMNFGFLTVYETPYGTNKFVSTPETYTLINADLTYSSSDPIYTKYGDYISAPTTAFGHPFVNFDSRGPVTIKISNDKLQIANEEQNAKVILPVKDKITETFGPDRGFKEAYNCDLMKLGTVQKSHLVGGIVYKAEDGGVACDYFDYPGLKSEQAYVLRIKGENKQGRSLKIYFQNWATNRMDLEELLPEGKFDNYFVIFGGPRTLNIETRSFGRTASENVIQGIELYPFDINFLTDLTQNSEKLSTQTNNLKILSVKKIGTAFYQVKTEGSGLLELGQGHESGWLALQITNYKLQIPNLLEHVKVNSWANGWIIKADSGQRIADSNTIYVIFWPQLLEWGGMILGFAVLIYLLVDKQRR